MRIRALIVTSIATTAVLAGLATPSAQALRGLDIGLADPVYLNEGRDDWMDRTLETGSSNVRILTSWASTAAKQPTNPRDPADPRYRFERIDGAVRSAKARGLDVMLTVQRFPEWAEGANRPPKALPGTWKPRYGAMAAYIAVLATRYSGTYEDLPAIDGIQLMNEPNLKEYLTPQWRGKKPVAAIRYRRMTSVAHRELRKQDSDIALVGAGLSPYGNDNGSGRTRPLQFWRDVFCLRDRKKLRKIACPKPGGRAHIDIMAHHPINTSGPPRQSALNPDDASSADMGAIARILRRAEKTGRVLPAGKRPLWVTETWWESNPPDTFQGVSLAKHARYIAESSFLFWKAGVSNVIGLRVRDGSYTPQTAGERDSTGAFFIDGTPKPAVRAYSFPFVVTNSSKRTVKIWGKAPAAGPVQIKRLNRRGNWVTMGTVQAGNSKVFRGSVRRMGARKFRATSGSVKSLAWDLKG